MTIEIKEKGTKEFYEEVVNVTSQYKKLINNPGMNLRNNFRSLRQYIVVCAFFLIALIVMGIMWGMDTMSVVGIVLMVIVIALCGFLLFNMRSMVGKYLADERTSVVTLDENGVELEKEGSQVVRLAWDSVAFVRVFKESVCFVSKDVAGLVLAINKGYQQQILDYLRTNEQSVKVIG